MTGAQYTREDLLNKSLLKLRTIYKEETGKDFDNAQSKSDLMDEILQNQASAPKPTHVIAQPATILPEPTFAQPVAQQTDVKKTQERPVPKPDPKPVLVSCGSHPPTNFQLTGMTIGKVRLQLRDALNVTKDMRARLNGFEASDDIVLQGGESLEFIKPPGDKA